MNLSRLLLVLALFLISAGVVPAQTPPPDVVEKVFAEEIKLNVSAFDRNGKFVPDVRKEDLVIVEDDILHQADSLRRLPANVLIVLDTGGELRRAKDISQTRLAAKTLIKSLLPEDSVAVVQYHDRVEVLAEWTSDKRMLYRLLDEKLNFGKRSVFSDALSLATDLLEKSNLENRHLVLISDGTDSLAKKNERDRAMNRLLASSISVHVISYTQMERAEVTPRAKAVSQTPPPKAMPDEVAATLPNGVRDTTTAAKIGRTITTDREFLRRMRERERDLIEGEKYLADLADGTSGEFILPASMDEMIEKTDLVARTIDSNYVVTYTPKRPLSDAAAGEIRKILVSSKRPGLQVLARRKLVVENN